MATNFPGSLDTLTNPTSSDSLSSPSHSAQHANVNDAVEALQAKVGVDSSAVTTSLDYKVAQLEALGTAVAFTPSWTNFTVGNGTEEWYYIRIGDFVHVYGNTLLGSTSVVGGSQFYINPPVAIEQLAANFQIIGTSILFEAGVGYKFGAVFTVNGLCRFNPLLASGTYLAETNTSTTVPFTWAAGDAIGATFTYKAD
jgi:hypothetical protein